MGKSSVKAKSSTSFTGTELAVQEALSWLRETASSGVREGMARFGIPSDKIR